MQKSKKDYYTLKEVAKECHCTVDDLLHFGETGQLKMCVALPPTIVEITRLTPISELDENSYWAKLINEPHEDSEQAKRENPLEFIHESVKMDEIAGPYHLFAGDVISIRRGDSIASVHDGNFDTNRTFYRFLNDNGRPANKSFNVTDIVIPYEEKMRFGVICDLVRSNDIGEKERATWLKIIYLLIHKLAASQENIKKGSGDINISALEKTLKKEAKKHDLTTAKLGNNTLGNIYKEAVSVLEPHYTPKE